MAKTDQVKNPEPKRNADKALGAIKDKAKAHEKLNEVLKQPQLQKVIDEFTGNPDARKEAGKDIVGHLKRKGVVLPEGVTVELKDDNWSIWFCWNGGGVTCCCWWDWWWGWACACW